jgi:hypothetical protein
LNIILPSIFLITYCLMGLEYSTLVDR